jgi:hypothetical protein
MKNFNPWAFGILFVILFIYLSFNGSNWSLLFTEKKEKTNAFVINTKIGYGMRGYGYMQYVNYVFFIDGEIYKGQKKIGKKYNWQYVGNTLNIKYSVKNPNETEIIKFNNEFNSSKGKAFLSHKKEGYYQLELINEIYFLKDHAKGGILVKEEMGEFKEKADTLTLKPFLKSNFKKYVINDKGELINIKTGIIYK